MKTWAQTGFFASGLLVSLSASFGATPHRYVLQRRVARAAHLLRTERWRSIADIAFAAGFASQSHLSNAFKCHMGQTPARWRSP